MVDRMDDERMSRAPSGALAHIVRFFHAALSFRSARRRWQTAIRQAFDEERAHGHGFLWGAVAFVAGAGLWQMLDTTPPLAALVIPGLVFAGIGWQVGGVLGQVALIASFVAAGFLVGEAHVRSNPITILDSAVVTTVAGTVRAREIDGEGHIRYVIDVTETRDPRIGRPPERVRILARSGHEAVPIGEHITGTARLAPPSGPALPGTFDFTVNAYGQRIGAYGFFYGAPHDEKGEVGPVSWRTEAADRVRSVRETIALRIRSVLPGDAGAVAAAMTVSDRRAISEETNEAFRATGLAHILSISGLHMSLAAAIMFTSLRAVLSLAPALVQAFPVKKIAAAGALVSSTLYLLISGAVVSAERAWIMVAIMLVAVILDRPALTLRNVAIAAIVIVALSPMAVLSPGFQMSFAATAALIAAYGGWTRRSRGDGLPTDIVWASRTGRVLLFVVGLAMTSLVAGLATGIFSAHHFHRMSGLGLVANIAAMPVISVVVMPMATAALLAMPFGLDAPFLIVMGWGLEAVIAVGHLFAGFGGDFAIGQVPLAVTLLLTAALVIAVLTRTWLRLAAIVPFVIALSLGAIAGPSAPDVLMSEDGRLVGLVSRSPDGSVRIATNKTRPSDFVFDQWQRALKSGDHIPPDQLYNDDGAEAASETRIAAKTNPYRRFASFMKEASKRRPDDGPRFLCHEGDICVAVTAQGLRIATIGDPVFLGPACDMADIVVTALRLQMRTCRSGAYLATATTLRETGAQTLQSLESKAASSGLAGAATAQVAEPMSRADGRRFIIRSALAGSHRPWTRHRYYDWRSRRFVEPHPAPTLWTSPERPTGAER